MRSLQFSRSFLLCGLLAGPLSCVAFTPARLLTGSRPAFHRVFSSTADEVTSMRVGEMKKELESYGISTRSFLEKSEVVEALMQARADGLQPKASATTSSSSSSSSSSTSSTSKSSSTSSTSTSSSSSKPREERLREEMENCQKMKAGELKKELEELGISTKSFFEKSEFVKALAAARVDGIEKKSEEGYAEYADVEVLTDENSGPRKKQDPQEQQQKPQQSPFGGAGGGNPFGGAGGMGGMGGMGGIADMLKNMGGMGGAAGANPFGGGGMGGMGGMGDAMGKAQELMKNPKVMELVMKAQSNPKMMKAMQECMSNPAAFAKYQNDPEVSELINELKKYM